jgi:hypothetical protein
MGPVASLPTREELTLVKFPIQLVAVENIAATGKTSHSDHPKRPTDATEWIFTGSDGAIYYFWQLQCPRQQSRFGILRDGVKNAIHCAGAKLSMRHEQTIQGDRSCFLDVEGSG